MYEEFFNKDKREATRKEYSFTIDKKTMHYQRKYGFELNPNPKHRTWNVEADAFKHAFLSAEIALKEGSLMSWGKGVCHEFQTPNNPEGERNMDSWNNNAGREIANELRKEHGTKLQNYSESQIDDLIANKIMQRMKKGQLITHPTDKRKYTGFATNIQDNDVVNILPLGKIFTAEEIGEMSSGEFSKNEPSINAQMSGLGIPREFEAKQAVQNGSMIWVNPYQREDGTEVKGYYRAR